MNRLTGKTAIVTGGARGIGRACVERMIEEGAQVAIFDVMDAEGEALAHRDPGAADSRGGQCAGTAGRGRTWFCRLVWLAVRCGRIFMAGRDHAFSGAHWHQRLVAGPPVAHHFHYRCPARRDRTGAAGVERTDAPILGRLGNFAVFPGLVNPRFQARDGATLCHHLLGFVVSPCGLQRFDFAPSKRRQWQLPDAGCCVAGDDLVADSGFVDGHSERTARGPLAGARACGQHPRSQRRRQALSGQRTGYALSGARVNSGQINTAAATPKPAAVASSIAQSTQ